MPLRTKSRRGRPPKTKAMKREAVVSARVTEDVYARIERDAAASNRNISAHLAALLGPLGEIGEADLNRLVRFRRAVQNATEAAGEDPGRWFLYAAAAPFPASADDPDFEALAQAQVRAAVERRRDEAAVKLAGKSVGVPRGFTAADAREEADRFAAARFLDRVEQNRRRQAGETAPEWSPDSGRAPTDVELERVMQRAGGIAEAQAAQARIGRYSPNPKRRRPPLTAEQRAERKAHVQSFIAGGRWMADWGGRPSEGEIEAAVKTAKRRKG